MGSVATRGLLMSDASSQFCWVGVTVCSLVMTILHNSNTIAAALRADAGKGRSVAIQAYFVQNEIEHTWAYVLTHAPNQCLSSYAWSELYI